MDELKVPGIYLITNKVNGKRYIGKAINVFARWRGHKSKYASRGTIVTYKQTKINYDIQKYGEENFEIKILHHFKDEQEYLLESYYFEQLFMCYLEPEYNIGFGFGHGCTNGLDIADEDYCIKARTTWDRDLKNFRENYLNKDKFLKHYELRSTRYKSTYGRMRV